MSFMLISLLKLFFINSIAERIFSSAVFSLSPLFLRETSMIEVNSSLTSSMSSNLPDLEKAESMVSTSFSS